MENLYRQSQADYLRLMEKIAVLEQEHRLCKGVREDLENKKDQYLRDLLMKGEHCKGMEQKFFSDREQVVRECQAELERERRLYHDSMRGLQEDNEKTVDEIKRKESELSNLNFLNQSLRQQLERESEKVWSHNQ